MNSHNSNLAYIPDLPHRILISCGSLSGKTNVTEINKVDKIQLY